MSFEVNDTVNNIGNAVIKERGKLEEEEGDDEH